MIERVLLSHTEILYLRNFLNKPYIRDIFSNDELDQYRDFKELFEVMLKDKNTNSGYLSANFDNEFKPIKRYQEFIISMSNNGV